MFKFLTPFGRIVLVGIPASIVTVGLCWYLMWAVPDMAYWYFMCMAGGPAVIFAALTEEK